MRRRLWLVGVLLVACGPVPQRDPDDPYAWLRCQDAATPDPMVQDTLLGAWWLAFRSGSRPDTVALGDITFKLLSVQPGVSRGQHVCKDCLWGEYFGPFPPELERLPPSRDHLAIMRGDRTMAVSIGGVSAEPHQGDLALCGALVEDTLTGLWWQNVQTRPWGTFVGWRR